MIYFMRRSNGDITFGITQNLDKTLADLNSFVGKVELLGVMPGGNKEYDDLIDRFAWLKVEGIDAWFSDFPALVDFIDENATLEVSNVKPSARYRTSEYTPVKQQALSDALQQQMNMIVQFTKNWNKVRPYKYFDLNAGPGISKDDKPGSPVIFNRIASEFSRTWKQFRYEGYLYEPDPITYARLVEVLGDDQRLTILKASHEMLGEELKKQESTAPKLRAWVYGTVYADPSNATLPWELLELMNRVYPRIDVMINIACASYKRTIAQVGYKTLAERLPRIKKHWIVRKPFGKHQWSILIGTNWDEYPAWKQKEFYPWNDGDMGEAIFEKLVYTPEQRQQLRQLPLWDEPNP